MDNIRSKIRKLLAMAGDVAASENERAFAMKKAQELIEEHNIEMGSIEDAADHVVLTKGSIFVKNMKYPYHRLIGAWVAKLYDCQHFIYKDVGGHSYWGANHSVEAAEETFLWVVAQVEDLYRLALKAFDGELTKSQRAELRASFKDAAAQRIAERIHRILVERSRSRDSRALVVVDTIAAKIQEEIAANEIKKAKQVALREGFGTNAGYQAGELVKIQRDIR